MRTFYGDDAAPKDIAVACADTMMHTAADRQCMAKVDFDIAEDLRK